MSLQEIAPLASLLWLATLAAIVPARIVMRATVHRSRPHMLTSRVLEIAHPLIVPLMVIATASYLITLHSVGVRLFDLFSALAFLGVNWVLDAFAPCPTCRTGLWKRAWDRLWRPVSAPQHSF